MRLHDVRLDESCRLVIRNYCVSFSNWFMQATEEVSLWDYDQRIVAVSIITRRAALASYEEFLREKFNAGEGLGLTGMIRAL